MYEQFYGFKEKPFQITPNPAFLYRSAKHDTALTYLEYGLTENVGFILLTGEIGSGKTTLVQYIMGRLEHDIEAAVILNTNVSADELLPSSWTSSRSRGRRAARPTSSWPSTAS